MEIGRIHWVERIWTAINISGLGKIPPDMGRLGYYATMKLRMIDMLIRRLNQECDDLYEEARCHENRHVFTPDLKGKAHAFKVNDELKYWIMIDIDSLLFEIDSCCELIKKFLSEVYEYLNIPQDPQQIGIEMKCILEKNNKPTEWFALLDRERNFFIHEGAPYHAIDITNENYDLIIMKDNIKHFENKDEYTKLSEINTIVKGFFEGIHAIQEFIIELIGQSTNTSLE